jgi:hypothetical protein
MGGPLQAYYGQFSVNALTMAVGNVPNVNIAAGDYFSDGYTGEGTTQFAAAMQAGIRTIPTQTSANVTCPPSTGKFVIALTAASNISFLTDRLANIAGFSNGLVQPSTATHTAPSQARYVWRPSRAPSGHPVGIKDPLIPRSSTIYGRAPDGTTFSVVGSLAYDGYMEYHSLPAADVITPDSGTIYVDAQQWFKDVAHEGRPFRLIVNRSQYAATTDYTTCVWHEDGEDGEVGSFGAAVRRHFQSHNGLWAVRLPLAKKV